MLKLVNLRVITRLCRVLMENWIIMWNSRKGFVNFVQGPNCRGNKFGSKMHGPNRKHAN